MGGRSISIVIGIAHGGSQMGRKGAKRGMVITRGGITRMIRRIETASHVPHYQRETVSLESDDRRMMPLGQIVAIGKSRPTISGKSREKTRQTSAQGAEKGRNDDEALCWWFSSQLLASMIFLLIRGSRYGLADLLGLPLNKPKNA